METAQTFGFAQLWAQSDFALRTVAIMLLIMSVTSWYLILVRILRQFRARNSTRAIDAFWDAPDLSSGLQHLSRIAPDSPAEELAQQTAATAEHIRRHAHSETLGGKLDKEEFMIRAMRKSISASTARLESGLTMLASIGSTAPFIGLFGTVWGIYHALVSIAASGLATLDRVAGPVGEALIMTAFGLFTAIPAVLAYNAFTRVNRIELSELDAFAHDLHAWFCTGARVNPLSATVPSQPQRAHTAVSSLASSGATS